MEAEVAGRIAASRAAALARKAAKEGARTSCYERAASCHFDQAEGEHAFDESDLGHDSMGWSLEPPDEAELEHGYPGNGSEGGVPAPEGQEGVPSNALNPDVLARIIAKKLAAKARKAVRLEALAKAAWPMVPRAIPDAGGGSEGGPDTAPGGEARPP